MVIQTYMHDRTTKSGRGIFWKLYILLKHSGLIFELSLSNEPINYLFKSLEKLLTFPYKLWEIRAAVYLHYPCKNSQDSLKKTHRNPILSSTPLFHYFSRINWKVSKISTIQNPCEIRYSNFWDFIIWTFDTLSKQITLISDNR